MNRSQLIEEVNLTGAQSDARVLIVLPDGGVGLVKSIEYDCGEVLVYVTMDIREEMK